MPKDEIELWSSITGPFLRCFKFYFSFLSKYSWLTTLSQSLLYSKVSIPEIFEYPATLWRHPLLFIASIGCQDLTMESQPCWKVAPGVEKGESHVNKQVPLLVHAYQEHTRGQGGGPPSEQWCWHTPPRVFSTLPLLSLPTTSRAEKGKTKTVLSLCKALKWWSDGCILSLAAAWAKY